MGSKQGKSMDKIQRFYQIKDILGKCNENLSINKNNNQYSILLNRMEEIISNKSDYSKILSENNTKSYIDIRP